MTALFSSNVTGYFPGHIPNQDVMRHYKEKPVDVFVNLRSTEGGAPISIQEAILAESLLLLLMSEVTQRLFQIVMA